MDGVKKRKLEEIGSENAIDSSSNDKKECDGKYLKCGNQSSGAEVARPRSTPNNEVAPMVNENMNTTADVAAPPLVSIIMPAHNAGRFFEEGFASVLAQTHRPLELSVFDDASQDNSLELLDEWKPKFEAAGVTLVVGHRVCDACKGSDLRCEHAKAGGAGAARNAAVANSSGSFLCFLDADDIMMPHRVEVQLAAACQHPNAIVGARFRREPEGSTAFYTDWLNNLLQEELYLHQYRECTLILPTWFMARAVFTAVRFEEVAPSARGQFPEDLVFFNKHLEGGGALHKVEDTLMIYRYVPGSVCFQIPRKVLVETRVPFLERRVLAHWPRFSIWGAGRDGKFFLNQLSNDTVGRVEAFCDVDEKKIAIGQYFHQGSRRRIPIVHFTSVRPPLIICVAVKGRGGELRDNLNSLGLVEGVDYYHFS